MKNRYLNALVSSSLSIAPIILIVIILSLTKVAPLSIDNTLLIIVGMFVLIAGLALFQIGASIGLTKVGEYMGSSLSKQKNLFIVILFAFALGTLITCAEPSILIISKQVTIVQNNHILNTIILVGSIAIGVGVFVVIGVLRIIFHKDLKVWYLLFYALTFMLICLIALDPERRKLLPFIFDSGGVTTGSATVPFILALGAGVATVRGGKNASNDSFGLVGMASIGPILTMTTTILIKSNIPPYQMSSLDNSNLFIKFANALLPLGGTNGSLLEVAIALAPILLIFFIYNFIFIHLPKGKILSLLIGFAFSYFGLSLFLSATSAAMQPIGTIVGEALGAKPEGFIIAIAFIIGLVTILCEPAVHVLTGQMETISDGQVSKKTVLITLSLGVGIAIALAVIRTLFNFSILYYMVPGYALSIILMFSCPKIFTAMAFDSGGTASGPMATSFVLPMVIGITTTRASIQGIEANYYEQAFGVVAMIALTPILAIQILGVYQNFKLARARYVMSKHVYSEEDALIINF